MTGIAQLNAFSCAKNLIQIATTEMHDILLREINELYQIDKQPNSVHNV